MIYRTNALRAGAAPHKQRRTAMLADGSACAVPVVCPHQGLPLDCEPDGDGVMTCPWHGYRFDARTGACLSGQIKGWRALG
ncbi:Rieske (2Fe-2S) protein [Parasphingorhabdus halotolerans]|uniref:Rieske (2Fe-2S) protein n=2 Tax=Parasphingorhabdus halotolerans TaxID=2725558 RepID=A0A6H2DSS7_9SPHN|nr:Rieske (2Fe-2S) protein [Parasphingorhabdus halotolerans]